MPETLTIGSVIKWHAYPFPNEGENKDRFFLVMGKTGFGVSPVIFRICTTTTQFRHYQEGGKRANHLRYEFRSGEYGFTHDCLVDLDMGWDAVEEYTLKGHKIDVVGTLPDPVLRSIYSLLVDSKNIPKIVKQDIFFALQRAGIHGLKRP